MKIDPLAAVARVALCLVLSQAATAWAADIKVLSTPTLKSTLAELGPQFERTSGHRLLIKYDSAGALKRQIEAGEAFDVTILLPPLIDDLQKQGKVAAGTRTDIARAAVGMATRAGAPKPDLASVEAFKQALLNAKSMSYAPDSASGAYFVGLFDRLGIAAEAKSRLKAVPGGTVVEAVAKGEADLTVITVPNIVGTVGVELAGLLPSSLQNYTVFAAGVSAATLDAQAAKALIEFLMAAQVTPAFNAQGLERIGP